MPGPGTHAKVERINTALSGNGGNVATVLARLGLDVALAGNTGSDIFGTALVQMLEDIGVNCRHLLPCPDSGTGTSVIAVSPAGERTIFYVNGANERFDLDTVPDAWLAGKAVVYLGTVFVLPQFTGSAVGRLFSRARRAGSTTVLNICLPDMDEALETLAPALAESDYLVLNLDEGRRLTSEHDPDQILRILRGRTAGRTIMTLGADGCCYLEDDSLCSVCAEPVTVVDTTGAGDSFIAGLIAGIAEGLPLDPCVRLASVVASYAVTGPGAYSRVPRLGHLLPKLRAHG
jgi:sugar/nucleoside kinase (ribokinase family)